MSAMQRRTVLPSANPVMSGASFIHRQLLTEITRAASIFHALGLTPDSGVAAFLASNAIVPRKFGQLKSAKPWTEL
jgi:hypothetical protein